MGVGRLERGISLRAPTLILMPEMKLTLKHLSLFKIFAMEGEVDAALTSHTPNPSRIFSGV